MIPAPSPITPTPDQAAAIAWLEAAGAVHGVTVDAGPLDETAHAGCDNDWTHGPAVVCTPDGYLCVPCALSWLRWHPGELVAVDVLLEPVTEAGRSAA